MENKNKHISLSLSQTMKNMVMTIYLRKTFFVLSGIDSTILENISKDTYTTSNKYK